MCLGSRGEVPQIHNEEYRSTALEAKAEPIVVVDAVRIRSARLLLPHNRRLVAVNVTTYITPDERIEEGLKIEERVRRIAEDVQALRRRIRQLMLTRSGTATACETETSRGSAA